jgi:hypothetical protein
MISHPRLISGRHPAVSVVNGSVPMRAKERGSGCAAKRRARCCTGKKPNPSGGAGTGATPSWAHPRVGPRRACTCSAAIADDRSIKLLQKTRRIIGRDYAMFIPRAAMSESCEATSSTRMVPEQVEVPDDAHLPAWQRQKLRVELLRKALSVSPADIFLNEEC